MKRRTVKTTEEQTFIYLYFYVFYNFFSLSIANLCQSQQRCPLLSNAMLICENNSANKQKVNRATNSEETNTYCP